MEQLEPRAKDPSVIGPDGKPLVHGHDHDEAFRHAWIALDEDDGTIISKQERRDANLRDFLFDPISVPLTNFLINT